MKRLLFSLTLCLACITGLADNHVGLVEIDVELQKNGNATITETWDVNINSTNTEWYLAKYGLANGYVSDLRVSDLLTGEEFITEEGWNVDRTRQQKAGRCGIYDKGFRDYELCWGVGSDGRHLWKVEYTHHNLVVAYADSCAFNHMFVSDDMSTPPDSVSLTIRYPGHELTDSIASVWGFRYHGYVAYENGAIVARTTKPLTSKAGVDVMAAFDKSLFDASVELEDNFAVLKEKAFEGSDYKEKTWWQKLLTGIGIAFAILLAIILYYGGPVIALGLLELFCLVIIPFFWRVFTLYPLRRYIKRQALFIGTSPWSRDIPSGNCLADVPKIMAEYTYNFFPDPDKWDKKLTAAYIMKLICDGGLKIHKEMNKKTGKMEALLEVNPDWERPTTRCSENDEDSMKSLYEIIKAAAGSDLILQDGEMKKYRLNSGRHAIKEFYKLRKKEKVTVNKKTSREILGLYNYLKEFSLLHEKGVVDVVLWNNYLVYATVFGIADKVMKQMQKIAPDYFKKSDAGQLFDSDGTAILTGAMLYGMSSKIRDNYTPSSSSHSSGSGGSWGGYSSRSSGGGGWSSYGGGGGHTGGGGGGGR